MNKKILFFIHFLNYRGVCNSTLEYAKYNEEILGNESVIIYNPFHPHNEDELHQITQPKVVAKVSKRFKLLKFNDWYELDKIASSYDAFYVQKMGRKEPPLVRSTKSINHVVFNFNEPHGDVYAYISEWLSDFVYYTANVRHPYVPYIVSLPTPNEEAVQRNKRSLGIRDDQFVFGRLGAFDSFDIVFVKETIKKIVDTRDDMVFVFPHTEQFYEHKNIHYLPPINDQQTKADYIGMCDAMIHARELGESFGLANAEFLYLNKPVLSWEDGTDRNHIRMLEPFKLLYNEKNVMEKMITLKNKPRMNYASAVESFSPERVMKKFDEVFLCA